MIVAQNFHNVKEKERKTVLFLVGRKDGARRYIGVRVAE